jgi:AraC-like DNA-binding protein
MSGGDGIHLVTPAFPHGEVLRSALLHRALSEFRQCTGISARLVPASTTEGSIRLLPPENDFCRAMRTTDCRRHCAETQARLLVRLEHKLRPQQVTCPAGLVHLAVPVVVRGRHVATILGGRVRVGSQRSAARSSLLNVRAPSVTAERFRTAVRLLDVLARFFETVIAAAPVTVPSTAGRWRELGDFLRQHWREHLSTREAATALHLSEAYFCRWFHQFSGRTFHQYLAELRVKAAQSALQAQAASVSDVAMSVGFQSVSDFNRVFKAITGMTPTAYRRRGRAMDS